MVAYEKNILNIPELYLSSFMGACVCVVLWYVWWYVVFDVVCERLMCVCVWWYG